MATQAKPATALVYGRSWELLKALPTLLTRAGFAVTVVTSAVEMKRCRNVARLVLVPQPADVGPAAIAEAKQNYDLVLACDDETLRQIRRADLRTDEKVRLLPVASEKGIDHIASKIGLSQALTAGGVLTPPFASAQTPADLPAAVEQIGFPLLVKSDFGSGGNRVYPADNAEELARFIDGVVFPVLVQGRIDGVEVDCSSFFHNGELVAPTTSTVIRLRENRLGASALRRYVTRPEHDPELIKSLKRLGRALDANGFANISAMKAAADGRLYFFEADMRPNIWVEHPRQFGADPAPKIAAAFGLPPVPIAVQTKPVPDEMTLAHLPRLPLGEVLRNAYGCRDYYDSYDGTGIAMSWVDYRLRALTLRRFTNFLRSLIGLSPAKSRSGLR